MNEAPISGPFLFIVNPNSGTGIVQNFGKALDKVASKPDHEVVISESGAHSITLAKSAKSNGFVAVVAVGGDGSVNEIGQQLINSDIPLGIVPTGSGNGIARHFKISTQLTTAIKQAFKGKVETMDTLKVNDRFAIGFCGVGVDGFIAHEFNQTKDRGFSNYVKLTIDAFGKYQPTEFNFEVDGQSDSSKAYTVVVANAQQFGNNAFINPKGKDNDGLLELILVKAFPPQAFPAIASRLFLKNIHQSKYIAIKPGKRFRIENLEQASLQIDGEFAGNPHEIIVEVVPSSLNILVP